MKDREIVRMAYRFILGREPESDTVLDREFEDIYTLRNEFINSPEFLVYFRQIRPQVKNNIYIKNFEQLDNLIFKYKAEKNDNKVIASYNVDLNSFYELFGGKNPHFKKPYSKEYQKWEMDFFEFLSGKKYQFDNEGLTAEELSPEQHPASGYTVDHKIRMLQNYKDLLVELGDVKGKRILEMGCGHGNLAIFFEFVGCDYYAVEAQKNGVDITKKRIYSNKIKNQIINKSFYDISDFTQVFDLVVFEASFHHCGEPIRILDMLYKQTTSDARLLFLREPFHNYYDRPWGIVRADVGAMIRIRMSGWLELGYRTDFFMDLLNKTGWKGKEVETFTFADEKVFIATKI